jgi:flagellar protein FliO/FliZ
MGVFDLIRTFGALALVLGLLGVGLWAVRRFDLGLPGRVGALTARRVELVERTAIDARRSLALVRRDGREHLILLTPEGSTVVETMIVRDALDAAAEAARNLDAAEERAAAAARWTELRKRAPDFAALIKLRAGDEA